MKKIKNIKTALAVFEEASLRQAEATEQGDYKSGNKLYSEITKAAAFIKSENAVEKLKPLLSHSSVGVRMWAAFYLLPIDEKEGVKILREIAKSPGIHALTADTTLTEWQKGNIKF